jgi:beta-glucanase (GH16 family)
VREAILGPGRGRANPAAYPERSVDGRCGSFVMADKSCSLLDRIPMSTAPASTLNLSGYTLTFDDEFNSFDWNSTNRPGGGTWSTEFDWGRTLPDQTAYYSDATIGANPISDSNGVLSITAAASTNAAKSGGLPYTTGVITTQNSFSQEQGYFEISAKLTPGQGIWDAFWLVPESETPKNNGEIDVFEAFGAENNGQGGSNQIHVNAIQTVNGAHSASGGWETVPANIYNTFNDYGVMWTATTLTYYFNCVARFSTPTPASYDTPMYMLANLELGGSQKSCHTP